MRAEITLEEFLNRLASGKAQIDFNNFESESEAYRVANILDEHGFVGWDRTAMEDYIRTRFLTHEFRYLLCDSGGKTDVTASGRLNRRNDLITNVRGFLNLAGLKDQTISDEDFDSILE